MCLSLAIAVATGTSAFADTSSASPSAADDTLHAYEARGAVIAADDPLYAPLRAVTARISVAAAASGYSARYVLVRDGDPNAFAATGGIVFLTDSLMRFVENREELAGILCHETAHLINADAAHAATHATQSAVAIAAVGSALHLNRSLLGAGGANAAVAVSSATYSREQESAADSLGARLCARAGLNPWGLVWLLQKYERSEGGGGLEVLADHPSEASRVQALEDQFRAEPETFGRFPIDLGSASAL
jgi:predicted Zn-dependent protease